MIFPNEFVIVAPAVEHDSDAWHFRRANTVGASEIGMALGVSKYGGLLDLILTKRDLLAGKIERFDNDAMAAGRDAEATILKLARRKLDLDANHELAPGELLTFGNASATPDAVVIDAAGRVVATVEAKLDRARHDWQAVIDNGFGGLEAGDTRLLYFWQVQAQLHVTGCKVGYLAVWQVWAFYLIKIEADADAAAAIVAASDAAMAWVNDSLQRLPAATDADTLAALARTIKPAADETLTVDGEIAAALESYGQASAAIKALEIQQDAAKRIILAAHADAAKLQTASGFKSSFVAASTRNGIDTAKLTAELPDIAAAYQKTTSVSAGCRITSPKVK